MTKPRRPRKPPQERGKRLLKILQTNLKSVHDPALRERLQRALAALEEKQAAA
jgi:hypothetical protein